MKRISLFLAFALLCAGSVHTASYGQNLVPRPVSVERGEGTFHVAGKKQIDFNQNELAPLAEYLSEYWPAGKVLLSIDDAPKLPAEGYRLTVSERDVRVVGKDYGGVWNGIQTLLQLLPPKVYARAADSPVQDWSIPTVTIEDYPALAYRGQMLDVARTFVPKEQVLRFIDNISRHKINKFHWHLVDDEGWRIEIKSYPLLTGTGGFRGGDSPVMPIYGAWNERYGGYYTQDDIREVVAYAAVRNVEIIPEIDLPGHCRAAAIAYPDILCNYEPDLSVSAGYDIRNVWCASHEENYEMLDAIIGEVAALFPSENFHLGGDEVAPGQWGKCPDCRALMAVRGITEPARLQDVFMERVIGIANAHGKKAFVWNEAAASGGIPKSTTVSGWESIAAARKAAGMGYPTVVCPGAYFYFDMRQSPSDIGHIWAGIVTLEKVYSFDFAKEGFTPAEMTNVRGIEATFFSELLLENGPDFLDYQLFPRICALAEITWTPAAERSWTDFSNRLNDTHFARLDAMGIKYRAAAPAIPDLAPLKTPAATFTSSLRERSNEPFSSVASYKGACRTTTTCVEGDWFQWTFAAPVTCTRIDIKTGYDHLQRAGIPDGRVEVSYDGVTFETAATLRDLKATLTAAGSGSAAEAAGSLAGSAAGSGKIDPLRPIRAIRVVSDSHGNGEDFVIMQSLKIR